MKHLFAVLAVVLVLVFAQGRRKAQAQGPAHWQADLTQPQPYVLKRVSSADPTGGNADSRSIEPGATLTVFDVDGPAVLTHLWFTLYDPEPYHLKKLVLRMYWDGEATPSVETPLGDFFGLGLGDYHVWESELLSVANERALNCFFLMPFQKHARLTVTNEGKQKVSSFYFNLDYRALAKPLPADTLYFHAQFRQAQPNLGWTNKWESNGDPLVEDKKNLDGEGNYVWMEAKGRGQFVGVTMSVLQNQDGWWGEGDDMFFIDGESLPSIAFTLILPFPSQNLSAPPSSTDTPITARTTIIPWPTGIRANHTRRFRRWLRRRHASRNFSLSAVRATPVPCDDGHRRSPRSQRDLRAHA